MNKQELIEKIEVLPAENYKYRPYVDKKVALGLVRQLDEPEKEKIPQFVADWYEENKDDFEGNLFRCIYEIYKKRNDNELTKFEKWIIDDKTKPFKTLVNMHQFGYVVEKEKRYLVKVKGICGNHETLNREKHSNKWLFSDREENSLYGTHHTRKELEDAGFGEVFNSPLFEVVEVE